MRKMRGSKRQARILVVDNERSVALSLSEILVEQGYMVATAFSGEQAVAMALGFDPDLLVSEVFMGAMNGIEAATRITATLPNCGVLFLSGHASMSEVLSLAPEHLVFSFTQKPFHLLDFLTVIACMISAVSTADDLAWTAAETAASRLYAFDEAPAKAGFILAKTGNGIGVHGSPRWTLESAFS